MCIAWRASKNLKDVYSFIHHWQVFREARRSTPSVIYIPHIDSWWQVLSDTMRATFLMMLSDLDPLMSILLLATADTSANSLPLEVSKSMNIITFSWADFQFVISKFEICRKQTQTSSLSCWMLLIRWVLGVLIWCCDLIVDPTFVHSSHYWAVSSH